MTRTKSSRALLSVVLAVLMAAAFMPSLTYSSFAATAKKATKVTKVTHADKAKFTRTVGTAWTLKYKLSPSKLTSAAKKVVWKSSNSKVAKITTIKAGKAVVSFKSTGSASVTVYTKANKKAKTTWNFKVVEKKAAAQKVAATGVTVAADNSDDYTKTLKAGTTLTATVAPANATGVTYQWYADGTAISGATSQKFKVTTDQIGKEISVKATDDSKNTIASTASAKVSDVTLTGTKLVQMFSDSTKDKAAVAGDPGYPVGTKFGLDTTGLTGAKQITDVAAVKWIRTIKSANGTAQDTTVAENTNTYTVTKADLAAVQKDATVTIKAEVTPNTGVKSYGTTSGKYTTVAAKINGSFVVSIQANGKDVTNVKSGTKLTAVTTPSDVKVTYQWYKDGKQIAGATSAEYTPTADGMYRVHVEVAKDETTFDKTAHADATVKVGGLEIVKAVVTSNEKDNTTATKNSILTATPEWTHDGNPKNATVTYQWYRNGVKLTDADAKDGKVATVTSQKLDLNQLKTAVTTNDSFYCVVTGTGEFLSDPVTSNTIQVTSLGTISKAGVHAYLFGNTLYVTGLDMNQYTAKVVTINTKKIDDKTSVYDSEDIVDASLDNHVKTDATTKLSKATDTLRDLTDAEKSSLYVRLDGANGYTGTEYVPMTNVVTAQYSKADNALELVGADKLNAPVQWQYNNGTAWVNCKEIGNNTLQMKAVKGQSNFDKTPEKYRCEVTFDGNTFDVNVPAAK